MFHMSCFMKKDNNLYKKLGLQTDLHTLLFLYEMALSIIDITWFLFWSTYKYRYMQQSKHWNEV